MAEEKINVTEKLQEVGKKVDEFKNMVIAQFKDMEVEVKNWNFAIGKLEAEYTLDLSLKVSIKPKKEP